MSVDETSRSTAHATVALLAYPHPPHNGFWTSFRIGWYGRMDAIHERRTGEGVMAQRTLWLYRKAWQRDAHITKVFATNMSRISTQFAPLPLPIMTQIPAPPAPALTGDPRVDSVQASRHARLLAEHEARAVVLRQRHEAAVDNATLKAAHLDRLSAAEHYNAASAHSEVVAWAEALASRYQRSRSGLFGLRRNATPAAIPTYESLITPNYPLTPPLQEK